MKFTVSSSALLSVLSTTGKVISSKNTLPILDYFLFELQGDTLKVTASDLDTTFIGKVKVDGVESEGVVAAPYKRMLDTLKEFSEQPLTIEIDNNTWKINISWATGEISIPGLSGLSYPTVPMLSDAKVELDMDADMLVDGINKTIFATADGELRPVMNSIFVNIEPSEVTFVATDAHKLVKYTQKLESGLTASFILPKKPANLLKTALLKEEGAIRTQFDNKNAMFHLGDFVLVCRLIEGTYPKYNSVIPQNNPNIVVVDRTELLNGIKRVAVCSSQATNLIKLSISDNRINLVAQDRDYSMSATENLSCSYEGVPIVIGFKSTFLVEILSNTDTQCISIELGDHTRAGVFKPVYDADETPTSSILMLLMPMMLQEDDKA
ncbi:MAG: DNA polymerase III subunit beta [Rikenellaceae bacterium]|jgi:DNA polymerase-3 subunit beta|nr:DNA polymerase III subunit beta [Rikenellaceae bacterium]